MVVNRGCFTLFSYLWGRLIIAMGLLSFFSKGASKEKRPIIPSLEEQASHARSFVNSFLDELYSGFDKDTPGEIECARFRIAGITHHCSRNDIGMIFGITFPQTNNPYDKKAIGLGRVNNGKVSDIFGYIPKEDKKAFNQFAGEWYHLPFQGFIREFITEDGKEGITGVIKLYKGEGLKMVNQMVKDAQLLQGLSKGYYKEQTLEEQELKLEWVLERHF